MKITVIIRVFEWMCPSIILYHHYVLYKLFFKWFMKTLMLLPVSLQFVYWELSCSSRGTSYIDKMYLTWFLCLFQLWYRYAFACLCRLCKITSNQAPLCTRYAEFSVRVWCCCFIRYCVSLSLPTALLST